MERHILYIRMYEDEHNLSVEIEELKMEILVALSQSCQQMYIYIYICMYVRMYPHRVI